MFLSVEIDKSYCTISMGKQFGQEGLKLAKMSTKVCSLPILITQEDPSISKPRNILQVPKESGPN